MPSEDMSGICQCDGPSTAAAIKLWAAEAGGAACGIARAEAVDATEAEYFSQWIAHGMHGGMGYMANYRDIRLDPRLLLPGAQSVIVVAFSYYHSGQAEGNLGRIAAYAHGDDYHEVVRRRLGVLAERVREMCGGETRVCVDTAPMLERYWAVRAGVGFIGRNRMLIVPGAGSYVFIGSVITTAALEADKPCKGICEGCGHCITACPAGALTESGLDARRCLSYLTIEHRGELPEEVNLCGRLYGCDECQRVCPHNKGLADTPIEEFHARQALMELTPERAAEMEQAEFSAMMRNSAIKRTKLAGLQRNALRLLGRK